MIIVIIVRFRVHRRISGHRVNATPCEAVSELVFARVTGGDEGVPVLVVAPLFSDARWFALRFNNDWVPARMSGATQDPSDMSVSDIEGMISSGPELDELDAAIESALRIRVRIAVLRSGLEDTRVSWAIVAASCGFLSLCSCWAGR